MINAGQLREYVIEPTLRYLDLYSEAMVNLLLGTAAQETLMGRYLHQVRGPACGIFQMEPATHDDLWRRYIVPRATLMVKLMDIRGLHPAGHEQLNGNMNYACAMSAIYYDRLREPLPEADDIEALAAYYKKYYNTPLGRATVEEFMKNYKRFV